MFIQKIEKLILNEDIFFVSANYKYIRIYRWNPSLNIKPWFNIYPIVLNKTSTQLMVLDVLFKIKNNFDSTLAFRRSCREGICGSCAMNINGLNSLACLKPTNFQNSSFLTIYPLPHLFVIKDLISDLTNFYNQFKLIKPWLISNKVYNNKLNLQSKYDRILLDGLYECILCACCSSSCPSYWWNQDKYLGPAVLLQTYRWIIDSRDENSLSRLEFLNNKFRVSKCHNIFNCIKVCPKKLNPTKAINILKNLIEK